MRVLITGGAGFIGSHTAELLIRQGHAVRVLDVLDPQVHGDEADVPDHLPPAVEMRRGDVRDAAAMDAALRGVEAVAHFAAFTGVGQSQYDLRSYADVNVGGTAAVVEAILRRGRPFPRLLLASSRAVYGEGTARCPVHGDIQPGPRPRGRLERGDVDVRCPRCDAVAAPRPTREDRTPAPLSFYGWTKRAQEEIVLHAERDHGLPVVILRYFNVYGSRQSLINPYTGVVNVFYNRLKEGRPIALYEGGRPLRDFVHVADVARANAAALISGRALGRVMNIGSGVAVTVRDVARALADALGTTPRWEDCGAFRVGDIFACTAAMDRARLDLGFVPRVRLAEGLAEFVRWAAERPSRDGYEETVDALRRRGLYGDGAMVAAAEGER